MFFFLLKINRKFNVLYVIEFQQHYHPDRTQWVSFCSMVCGSRTPFTICHSSNAHVLLMLMCVCVCAWKEEKNKLIERQTADNHLIRYHIYVGTIHNPQIYRYYTKEPWSAQFSLLFRKIKKKCLSYKIHYFHAMTSSINWYVVCSIVV